MEGHFIVTSKLTFDFDEAKNGANLKACDISLRLSDNLDGTAYLEPDGCYSEAGSIAVTNTLVAALAGNIKAAHANKWRDESEHMRYIISELERHFVNPKTSTCKGEMTV